MFANNCDYHYFANVELRDNRFKLAVSKTPTFETALKVVN